MYFYRLLTSSTTTCYYIVVISNTIYGLENERRIYLENITEMLKGSLEGCVLEIIGRDKTYGYEITQQLRKLGFSEVVEGTVYTILVRLEKRNFVSIEKMPSDMGPPRKFYSLTKDGRKELQRFWAKWDFVSSKINELKEV